MKKIFVLIIILLLTSVACSQNLKRNSNKTLNSQEYSEILDSFLARADKYMETGDKIKLLDDYIENIENVKVSQQALADNY